MTGALLNPSAGAAVEIQVDGVPIASGVAGAGAGSQVGIATIVNWVAGDVHTVDTVLLSGCSWLFGSGYLLVQG